MQTSIEDFELSFEFYWSYKQYLPLVLLAMTVQLPRQRQICPI